MAGRHLQNCEVSFVSCSQCSNYHTSRVGRGPPTSLNGPPTLRKFRGPKGAASGPPTSADSGGPIRPWKRSMEGKRRQKGGFWGKNGKRFSETPVKSVKKNFGKNLSSHSE